MMIANGQGLEAMQYVIKNRQKTEKDGRAMEQVYFGALDEYREVRFRDKSQVGIGPVRY